MRDVKSKGYFEQMKGRGTRTLDLDGLRKVSSAAKSGKTHYVIVDAIGVTKSLKTAIRDHVMNSFRLDREDLEYAPFDAQGGLGKMYQLFGERMDPIIAELNKELTA
jgi:type I site-specific restriction endonuclease